MTRDTDLIRRGDAIKAVTDADRDCRGAHGARENIAAIPAPPVQEPPSPGVTAGATGAENHPPFEFHRYINGQLMAEGVRIEKQATLEGAMVAAAKIASRGPNGEAPVLVLATPAPVVPAEGLGDIAGALARGYCAPENSHKELDADLINAMMREVAALRSAPPEGARVTGWQPIETVPRDGTPVDLWCLNLLHYAKRGFRKTNVSWGTVTDWFGTEREDWRHGRGEDIQPTHWMPLPEPPAALLPAGEGE